MDTDLTNYFAQRGKYLRLLSERGYTPHAKQLELKNDPHRYKVVRCGRRFGKTVFAVNEIIEKAVLDQGDYWFVAPTYRQAKEIAWRIVLKYLPAELIARKPNETELVIDLKNGSRIALKGADNPDSLRGVGLNGVVLDEFAFTDPYAWDVIRPILTDRKGWAIFISTPNGYNHFYRMYNEELNHDNYKSFHFTSYDNPYLDKGEIDDARSSMSQERFAQEYLAEFTKRAGAIWPFNRDVHIGERRNPNEHELVCGSIDFGFAIGHPTCVLWHAVSAEQVHTFDGFVEEGLTIDKISSFMRAQTGGLTIQSIYCDSARPDLIQTLKEHGWPVVEAKKDVELGIAKVGEYMQINPLTNKPRWTIARHLTKPIEQVEQYVWQEVRGGDGLFKQVPKKENDDTPDALRYFLYSYDQGYDRPPVIIGYEDGLGGVQIPIYG